MVMDVRSALSMLEGKYRFDIIFMDPPYNHELEKEVLTYLKNSTLLKGDTVIITEASLATDFSYADELGYDITKYKKYKTNAHVFLRRK
jgi:16S rRNA (guanine966-N2)-methyltransferase